MCSIHKKKLCLVFILLLNTGLFGAIAQDNNTQIDSKKETEAAYQKAKFVIDSINIQKNYTQSLNFFLDYCDYLHPLQFSQLEELAVAEAQEDIFKDNLLYKHDSAAIVLNDHDVVYDFAPYVADEIIAERLAAMKTTIPMTFNENIRNFIDYFTIRRRGYTQTMLARKNLYFPMFEKYLAEFNMPDELKYLAIVESALKPTAVSRAGAMGLWQFMPATGRHLGLQQNQYIDERINPEKATIAACKYLTWLYNFFEQDWELALAAYNCGPGTVQRALRKTGGNRSFWDIYRFLPAETRSYVPMFIAVAYSMTHAEEHNIIQNQPYYPIDYEVVTVNQAVNLKDLAAQLHVCLDDLHELNPELKKKIVPKHFKNYALKIPAERSQYFWQNEDEILAAARNEWHSTTKQLIKDRKNEKYNNLQERKNRLIANTAESKQHLVQRGESLSEIANQYSVSVAQLMAWNRLKSHQIKSGKHLVVRPLGHETKVQIQHGDGNIQGGETINMFPQTGLNKNKKTEVVLTKSKSKDKNVANTLPKNTKQPHSQNKTVHTVSNGDSLWGIANKYKTTINQLKQLNAIRSEKLQIGQKLVVR
jgi:membrane-bound lytic murein transglycosylase D